MKREPGRPLQLVTLNMEENKVEVNEDSLGRLEKRLKQLGANSVAVVAVMGAFRTGKSFLLDLFLRFLKFEADFPAEADAARQAKPPARGGSEEFALPPWIINAGGNLEGADDDSEGFRFKGGMDKCTEGIWIWSEPFMRKLDGQNVAVILMDTQGAWDGEMTKEQSATVFGLTAVLSSKQIYNIDRQIQEDKVENLAYFMRFAEAALRKFSNEMERDGQKLNKEEIDRPFQSLDFLCRDWKNFRDDWTVEQCMEQMEQHLMKHVNPQKMVENSTAEALHGMFQRLKCFCMPHPGFAIEKETWNGQVTDIHHDFLRFADLYVRDVFTNALAPKKILGQELSTITFPMILRDFVNAFHDAAPVAMSFTQAMTNCSVLLAKEHAMKSFTKRMDEEAKKNPGGIEPEKFEQLTRSFSTEVEEEYRNVTIFGSDEIRSDTWKDIQENLEDLRKRYSEENCRRLEKALVAFANISLLALLLFVVDRISDWTCDWWSQTCTDISKLLFLAYAGIVAYVGTMSYLILGSRGRIAVAMAAGELWKEMVRLSGVYWDLLQQLNFHEIADMVKKAAAPLLESKAEGSTQSASEKKKPKKKD